MHPFKPKTKIGNPAIIAVKEGDYGGLSFPCVVAVRILSCSKMADTLSVVASISLWKWHIGCTRPPSPRRRVICCSTTRAQTHQSAPNHIAHCAPCSSAPAHMTDSPAHTPATPRDAHATAGAAFLVFDGRARPSWPLRVLLLCTAPASPPSPTAPAACPMRCAPASLGAWIFTSADLAVLALPHAGERGPNREDPPC
jgi:hypothetical protein